MSQRQDLMAGPGGTDGPPPRGPLQWSGRVWVGAAVVVMVGALIASFAIGGHDKAGDAKAAGQSRPSPVSQVAAPGRPPAPIHVPADRRLIGARPLMFEIPLLWQQTWSDCGHDGHTVITTGQGNDPDACAPHASSVTIRQVLSPLQTGDLAMRRMTRPPHLLIGRLVRVEAGWQQSVGTIGGSKMFTITSQSKKTVQRIVASARAIPDGYTVVPSVVGLTATDADLVVEPVGLTLARYQDTRAVPDDVVLRITTQSIAPASIVARGRSLSVIEVPGLKYHPSRASRLYVD